jgi:hypothetical protein
LFKYREVPSTGADGCGAFSLELGGWLPSDGRSTGTYPVGLFAVGTAVTVGILNVTVLGIGDGARMEVGVVIAADSPGVVCSIGIVKAPRSMISKEENSVEISDCGRQVKVKKWPPVIAQGLEAEVNTWPQYKQKMCQRVGNIRTEVEDAKSSWSWQYSTKVPALSEDDSGRFESTEEDSEGRMIEFISETESE